MSGTPSDAWFHRQVQIGLDSANAGNLILVTEVEAKRTATRRRLETIRMMELFWTPEAIQDRDEIYDHIEADNQAAALALDELFSEKASRLVVARGYNG